MESSPMSKLPQDPLYQIFSSLPLRQIVICRSVCKFLDHTLSSPSFLTLLAATKPPLLLLALRPPHHPQPRRPAASSSPPPSLRVFDPSESRWLSIPLSFFPFRSPHPVASSGGLVYLWAEPFHAADSSAAKSLLVCNPLTREFRVLPQLGSAWSRHGSVLVDSDKGVIVLTELAALYLPKYPLNQSWLTFSSNLPSKPRSPVPVGDSVFAVCDVGSPWRSQWKLFSCSLSNLNCNNCGGNATGTSKVGAVSFSSHNNWVCVERKEWGDVMDSMKRPRLVQGSRGSLLMVGGLKSTFSLNPICSTILMLRLNLERMEWEEAGRMPLEMYRCFAECSKLKVFGGGDKVCFSAKRLGKLALWDESKVGGDVWRWVDGVPGGGAGDGLFRGFIFEARLDASP